MCANCRSSHIYSSSLFGKRGKRNGQAVCTIASQEQESWDLIYCTKESRLYNLKKYIYSLPLVASIALIKIWIKVPVTKARASTRGWWCAGGLPWTRTVPGCHSWGRSPGWGRDWGWRVAAAGSGADSGGTEEQGWPKGRATGRVGAPGYQIERPGLHPRCFPLSPCSCWRWSGWPSADRTSCRPGRFADRRGSVSAPPRPCDPSSAPSLPSGSAPRSPGSLPFPPLDSSCSKWMMRNWHYFLALYFGEPQQSFTLKASHPGFYLIVRVLQQQEPQCLQTVIYPLPSASLHLRFGDLEVGKWECQHCSRGSHFKPSLPAYRAASYPFRRSFPGILRR